MTNNDEIKLGDKVIAKPIDDYHVCIVSAIKYGWFVNRYILFCPTFGKDYYYKKYSWQLFKINN